MNFKTPLLASILSSIVRLVHSTACDLNSCIEPFAQYEKDTNVLFKPYNETGINEMCTAFHNVNTCVYNIASSCSNPAVIFTIWKGIENAFGYICTDGKKVFLDHRSCFADLQLQAAGEQCHVKYSGVGVFGNSGGGGDMQGDAKNKQICRTLHSYINCVESAVEKSCHANIARWQRIVLDLTLTPTLEHAHCPAFSGAGIVGCSSLPLLFAAILGWLIPRREA